MLNHAIWRAGDTSHNPAWPGRDFTLDHVDTQSVDVAVDMCLTHDVATAVKRHLAGASPGVGRPLIATSQGGTKSRAIASGQHAFERVESMEERQPSMSSVTLYEFDFEVQKGGSYAPSIALPIATAAREPCVSSDASLAPPNRSCFNRSSFLRLKRNRFGRELTFGETPRSRSGSLVLGRT